MKNCLKIVLLCCLCTILAGSSRIAYAAEGELSAKERYEAMFDKAIGLAEMLRTSPDMLHNKLYTAEQEVELQKLVDSACAYQSTDYAKARMLLSCIYDRLEPGSSQDLNAWDTLCDGESGWRDSSGNLAGKKKEAGMMVYCYTFYDLCRLADIPCFILSDGADCITMVYLEADSGTGKEWYFVDVASEKLVFARRENVYEEMGEKIGYPDRLVLDFYGHSRCFRNSIFLKELREDDRPAPRLVYDSDANTVKGYFPEGGQLAVGEQYGYTEAYFGDDGEAPSGLIETKGYSGGKVTTYRSYAVYGVFLRGRVEQDGKEYDLQQEELYSSIPYYDRNEVKSEQESAEHIAFVNDYRKQLEDKASTIADALLADKNYIWDDIYFEDEEDEKLVRDAVEKALDWDYIQEQDISRIAFENVGIPYVPWEEQDPEQLDRAKAQAILLYIKREIKSVEHGFVPANSASVLKNKAGVCEGIALLFRDMCVIAGVPCFRMHCSLGMKVSDSLFGDHADNMIKVGGEWLFCDPTNAGLIGKGGCIQLGFIEGYGPMMAADTKDIFIDREAMRKDNYYKWEGYGTVPRDYFEFDDDGKLAIYRRDRWGEPVPHSMWTDENGRYTLENGLHTTDVLETSIEGEIVTRYAYYYQNLRNLEGKKIIDGTEYDFTTDIFNVGYNYHKLQEVSRKYNIAHLTFQPLEDQPYNKDGACPVPEIYHGDKKLELGKDFEIVYSNNKALSTSYLDASYKVEGIGDYTGEAVRHFKIVKADVSNMEVKLSQTSFMWKPYEDPYDLNSYDFYDNKPEVDVPGLSHWTDYNVEYHNFGEVGKARVVITGKKNATGSITLEYEILPYQLQEEDIKVDYTETVYNGTVQKPKVTVEGFPEGKYYEVSYEEMVDGVWQEIEPKEAGEYRIVVQLTDNVELIKEGEKVPNIYYINYSIQADGSGSSPGESGSGSGSAGEVGGFDDGSGSGSTGGNTESSGDSGSGSSSGSTGSSTGVAGGNTESSSDSGSGSSSGSGSLGNSIGSNTSAPNLADNKTENGGSGSDSAETPDSSGTIAGESDAVGKLKQTAKKKSIKISWRKVKTAKGYQIQISQYKNYKKAKTVNVKRSKTSYTFKKLKKKTKYYIRIRVYRGTAGMGKDKNKVYGKWKKAFQMTK